MPRRGIGATARKSIRHLPRHQVLDVLRDCSAGRNADPAARELLRRLRKLVQVGKAFYPISDSTFSEYLKNRDPTARLEIARVVDELSLGVSLLDHQMRLGTETKWTLHDLRRTYRTIHARIGTMPHIAERLVNRASSRSDVDDIYDRHTYLPEMALAMKNYEYYRLQNVLPYVVG